MHTKTGKHRNSLKNRANDSTKQKPANQKITRKNDSPKAISKTFEALNENENEEDWRSPPPHKDTKQRLYDEEPATQEAEPQVESETQGGPSMQKKPMLRLTLKRTLKWK